MVDVASLPDVVVEGIANCISDAIGHFYDELATRNSRFPATAIPVNPRQNDLLSMCLIHRIWTPMVQRVMRKRIRIHSQRSLKRFLKSPHCGPWVMELWYIYDTDSEPRREGGKVQSDRSHWELLTELLGRTPKLRFISVELRDDHRPLHGQPDRPDVVDEDESGSENDTKHQVNAEDASAVNAEPEVEALGKSLAVAFGRPLLNGAVHIDLRGIMDTFRAIGRLFALEGLSILADVYHSTRIGSRNGRIPLPYFLPLFTELPKLTNLKSLHIRGLSSAYGAVSWYISYEGGRVLMQEKDVFDLLSSKTPPPSLKTLIIEITRSTLSWSHISWLQDSRNGYSLDDLFVVLEDGCFPSRVDDWARETGKSLPQLRNFRVELTDDRLDHTHIVYHVVQPKFLSQQSRLESLHIHPMLLSTGIASVPDSVSNFRFVLESVPQKRQIARAAWSTRDDVLVRLRTKGIPARCELLELSVTDREDEHGNSVCDRNDVRELLPGTFKYYEENGVNLKVIQENAFARRAADFLIYGRVRRSVQDEEE